MVRNGTDAHHNMSWARLRLTKNLPLVIVIAAIVLGGGWMAGDFIWSQTKARPAFGATYALPVYPAQLKVRIVPLLPSAAVKTQLLNGTSEAEYIATGLISHQGLAAACTSLEELCPFCYEIAAPRTIPDKFFSSERQQYRADLLILWLAQNCDSTSFRTIFVLAQDIYAPGMNYVLGKGLIGGPVCVASSARLGTAVPDSPLTCEERWHRILRHEFGHTLGLQHSEEHGSVMVYGDSLNDLDNIGPEFTRKDWQRLQELHPIEWPK